MRETIKLTTPKAGHEIELKTYLTGREKRALTDVFLNGDIDFDAESQSVRKMDYSIINKAQDLAWKTVIVSIKLKDAAEAVATESIIDTVLDMHIDDTNFITAEVNKLTNPKLDEEKKTS